MDTFEHHVKIVVLIGEVCHILSDWIAQSVVAWQRGWMIVYFLSSKICLFNTDSWQAVRAIKSLGQGVAYALSSEWNGILKPILILSLRPNSKCMEINLHTPMYVYGMVPRYSSNFAITFCPHCSHIHLECRWMCIYIFFILSNIILVIF